MDFSKFYVLRNAHLRGALHVDPDPNTHIPDSLALMLGEWRPERPLVFRHYMGGKPRDLIGTTFAYVKIVSDRVVAVLREGGFTGWGTYPVEVYGKDGTLLQGFHGFTVLGRCGPVDWSRSRVEWRPAPTPQGRPYQVRVGIYFDPATWDGSDVFCPAGTALTVVTEPVKVALEKAKVKNIEFTRLTEYESPLRPGSR